MNNITRIGKIIGACKQAHNAVIIVNMNITLKCRAQDGFCDKIALLLNVLKALVKRTDIIRLYQITCENLYAIGSVWSENI